MSGELGAAEVILVPEQGYIQTLRAKGRLRRDVQSDGMNRGRGVWISRRTSISRASASAMLTMVGIVILLIWPLRRTWREHKGRT